MNRWLARHAWLATWITLAVVFLILALTLGER